MKVLLLGKEGHLGELLKEEIRNRKKDVGCQQQTANRRKVALGAE